MIMNERMNERTNKRINEQVNEYENEQVNKCIQRTQPVENVSCSFQSNRAASNAKRSKSCPSSSQGAQSCAPPSLTHPHC